MNEDPISIIFQLVNILFVCCRAILGLTTICLAPLVKEAIQDDRYPRVLLLASCSEHYNISLIKFIRMYLGAF